MNGKLLDQETGEPIPFALAFTVRDGHTRGVEANVDGVWSYDFQPGETITFRMLGYQDGTAIADPAQFLISQLQPTASELGPVIVRPDPQEAGVPWWVWGIAAVLLLSQGQRRSSSRR